MLSNNAVSLIVQRAVYVMSDINLMITSAKSSLMTIAQQADGLAHGLEVAAPGDKMGAPNNSVSYLYDVAKKLAETAKALETLMHNDASASRQIPRL